MGVKISDATEKTDPDGTELFAVSDSLTAKSVSIANTKNYVIGQIEAIDEASSVAATDGIYILDNDDSSLKPVNIDVVTQYAIDTIWAKGKEASPVGTDEMALKDDVGVEKTVLVSALAESIRSIIEGDILDVSDLADGSVGLAGADYMLITQGGTGKYVTVQNVIDEVYSGLKAYVEGLSQVITTADGDKFYCINGGSGKYVELSQIIAHAGASVTKTGSTTENNIPQWTANDGELKDGLTLVNASFGAGTSTAVPTTFAVRTDMDTIIDDADDIGADLVDADTVLVDDGAAGTQRQSTFGRIWTWIKSKFVAVADVNDIANVVASGTAGWVIDEDTMATDSDTQVPTQQSVKAYVDSGGWDGDIADLDISTGTDIGEALVDADEFIVYNDSATANRRSDIERLWTYIQSKLDYRTIWVPVSEMTPDATNGPAPSDQVYGSLEFPVLDYDGTPATGQDEHAHFDVVMPETWDKGTIKAKVYWTNASGSSSPADYVRFYLQCVAISDDDPLAATLGSAVYMEDQLIVADDMHITDASAAITVGGSAILGDVVHFRLSRDFDYAGAGVAMTEDARVFGVLIQYGNDQVAAAW